jgi:hypothetical protein
LYDILTGKYGWGTAEGLPIGKNCRYFFNSSTLYATYTGKLEGRHENNDILTTNRRQDAGNYELHDGNLICEDMCYCVHDEGSAGTTPYIRKYHNMVMRYVMGEHTGYIGKCIGGGTGINEGNCIIENCQFYSNNTVATRCPVEISYHGAYASNAECHFKLTISGCYIEHRISLDQLGSNQTAECVLHGNSIQSLPNANSWELKSWNNEFSS